VGKQGGQRAFLAGAGAVGARAARQLVSIGALEELVVADIDGAVAGAVAATIGEPVRAGTLDELIPEHGDVVLLATGGDHRPLAERALERGAHVVSVSDRPEDVSALLDLDAEARERGCHVVVGAGFSPGLSCVLVARAAMSFERVDEVHVARIGTGGPACARQHHESLAGVVPEWWDGQWMRRRAGSGRQLCWFPDPVGGVDCYRAVTPDRLLLVEALPGVQRVSARVAATRRDRVTAHLPMMRRPHPEGAVGAIRVEVRGRRGAAGDEQVLGAVDRPALAAGAVCAIAARWALDGRLRRAGAGGLAEMVEPIPFLAALAERGVKAATFQGAAAAS
jgi:saccharopine dehydrogenase-like NADP-dependent oxidoreductase